jgi:hypothetical protein
MNTIRPTTFTRKYVGVAEHAFGHVHHEQHGGPEAVDGERPDGELRSVILHPLPDGEDQEEGEQGEDQHDACGVHPEATGDTGLYRVLGLGGNHNHNPPPTRR